MIKIKLLKDRQVDGVLRKSGEVVMVSDHIARRWKKCGYSQPVENGQKIGLDKSEKK